jgi:hypothetical protein
MSARSANGSANGGSATPGSSSGKKPVAGATSNHLLLKRQLMGKLGTPPLSNKSQVMSLNKTVDMRIRVVQNYGSDLSMDSQPVWWTTIIC